MSALEPRAESGIFGNALSTASFYGPEELVRLLPEKVANINTEDTECGNTLSAVSYAEDTKYGNTLSAASFKNREGVVRFLLERGVKVKGGAYGSAPSVASHDGHKEVVQLLLDKEANVNALSGRVLRKAS